MKRTTRIAAVLCLMLFFAGTMPQAAAEVPDLAAPEEWQVIALVNNERRGVPLSTFGALADAADIRAREIHQSFSHTRPDGTSCFTALSTIYLTSAGENIAAGQKSPEAVMDDWMHSEGHRQNILSDKYRHIGVGYDASRPFWTQEFIGGCKATDFEVKGLQGKKFNAADLSGYTVEVTCDKHGKSYLPLTGSMIRNVRTADGVTQVTVVYDGITKTYDTEQFSDVPHTAWYYDAVQYTVRRGIFSGTSDTTFSPQDRTTRAMFVTTLCRMEGVKVNNKTAAGFSDVKKGKWYTGAVKWAADNNIVAGSYGKFMPDAPVTREQICTIFMTYAKYKKIDLAPQKTAVVFKDAKQISKWAKAAVTACQRAGLIRGADGKFDPKGKATRAEVAQILMQFDKNFG